MVSLCLIAAMSANNVIGLDGKMPWDHIEADMQHFRMTTKESVVIMGRKTWDSLPRKPLPKRKCIVLTSDPKTVGYDAFNTAEETNSKTVFVIGGGQIYDMLIDIADEMYLTDIHATFDGDTYFPTFNEQDWDIETLITTWDTEVLFDPNRVTIKHYKKKNINAEDLRN